jgi:hypothetical protein
MTEDGDIRDADLLAKLEKARGGAAFQIQKRLIVAQQRERDTLAARRSTMGRDQLRRDTVREVIETDPTGPENLQHIHSVLALCGLPYKRPADDGGHFVRRYGRNSLALTAGMLTNPATGNMEAQGLPYGPKARLLLLHLCSEAIRQKSPVIEIADSLTAFIRDLGFPVTGGARGSLKQFKEQLNRLAACHMQIGLWDPATKAARTINAAPIDSFDVWLPNHPDQKVLWSSTLTFDERFFKSLMDHALPVDMRAARAFAGSARKLDLLFWLGYRLRSITRPYLLTWENLHTQFGQGTTSLRSFRQEFKGDLASMIEVFPTLPLKLGEEGMRMYPSDPTRLLIPPKHRIGKRC